MLLIDNKLFELPELRAGFFGGLDRLEIPYDILILKEVNQRSDNGDIELLCQAKDGPEEKMGLIRFLVDDRSKKDALCLWLREQTGKDVETIYKSEFAFEANDCPMCGNKMFESMEPKVGNLANVYGKLPKQTEFWRCSNEDCGYKEKI